MMPIKKVGLLIIAGALLLIGDSSGRAQVPSSVTDSYDVAVVVNPRNPINHLSVPELRAILLGERQFWKNRVSIIVILREAGSRERQVILRKVLRMDDRAFKAHWGKKLFRGEASHEPLSVSSNEQALEFVNSNPGAVTFLVGRNLRADFKVLTIGSTTPGVPGYPFR